MDHSFRIVTFIPMTELWTDGGAFLSARGRDLTEVDIKDLLRSSSIRFVVADVGQKLEWIPEENTFPFWKDEVMQRLVQLPHERTRLADHVYVASEWITQRGPTVLLLEKYH